MNRGPGLDGPRCRYGTFLSPIPGTLKLLNQIMVVEDFGAGQMCNIAKSTALGIWQPSHGILFSRSSDKREPDSTRNIYRTTPSNDSCILESSKEVHWKSPASAALTGNETAISSIPPKLQSRSDPAGSTIMKQTKGPGICSHHMSTDRFLSNPGGNGNPNSQPTGPELGGQTRTNSLPDNRLSILLLGNSIVHRSEKAGGTKTESIRPFSSFSLDRNGLSEVGPDESISDYPYASENLQTAKGEVFQHSDQTKGGSHCAKTNQGPMDRDDLDLKDNRSHHNEAHYLSINTPLPYPKSGVTRQEGQLGPPLHEPFDFQIPACALKEAMLASKTTGAAYWRYSLYENSAGDKIKVHYCKSRDATERIVQLFLDKDVVGFDIEWKPQASSNDGIKKNVSLVQLASQERIALFHIARFAKGDSVDDLVSPSLKRLMEDPNISKVGVSIKADCSRLRRYMNIEARGLFELSHLYKLVKFSTDRKKIDKKLVSLAKQVEEHLQLPLWKGDVRSSDWSEDLNYQQIQYAASDSYAGLQLYDTLEAKRKALDPTPPRPMHAELNLPIRLANGQTVVTYDEAEIANEPNTESVRGSVFTSEDMTRSLLDIAVEDYEGNSLACNEAGGMSTTNIKPPEVIEAEHWLKQWHASLPQDYKPRATPAFMRAYSLWYHQAKDVQQAATLLRKPPLQLSTVSRYILEAIRIEKLPFEKERLQDVLKNLSGDVAKIRYQSLRKQLT